MLEALQGVTLEEWEKDFEILHLCFKESIRLNLTNSLNRYYPGPSLDTHGKMRPRLVLGGEEIEDDTYIAFSPPSNLHDATAFPEPFKFDPFRYHRGQGETEYTYLGWGVGHHSEFIKLVCGDAYSVYRMHRHAVRKDGDDCGYSHTTGSCRLQNSQPERYSVRPARSSITQSQPRSLADTYKTYESRNNKEA